MKIINNKTIILFISLSMIVLFSSFMNEILKYNHDISTVYKQNNDEYLGMLCYGKKFQNKWQFTYGSQSYGTFYGMYSRFGGSKKKIKTIDLTMINYKGQQNLAIDTVFQHNNEAKFVLITKGLQNNDTSNYSIKLNNHIKLKRNDPKSMKFYRVLIPFGDKSGYKDGILDSEFFKVVDATTGRTKFDPSEENEDALEGENICDFGELKDYLNKIFEPYEHPPFYCTELDATTVPGFKCIRSDALITYF